MSRVTHKPTATGKLRRVTANWAFDNTERSQSTSSATDNRKDAHLQQKRMTDVRERKAQVSVYRSIYAFASDPPADTCRLRTIFLYPDV